MRKLLLAAVAATSLIASAPASATHLINDNKANCGGLTFAFFGSSFGSFFGSFMAALGGGAAWLAEDVRCDGAPNA